jgi:hypothetical protein
MWSEKPEALKTSFLKLRFVISSLCIRGSRGCWGFSFFCEADHSNPETVYIDPLSEITIANVTSFIHGPSASTARHSAQLAKYSSLVCEAAKTLTKYMNGPSAGRASKMTLEQK